MFNMNPAEIVAVERKGQTEGFLVGVGLTVGVYWMYKLNKQTIRQTIRRMTSGEQDTK